jgi:hypothetical protein
MGKLTVTFAGKERIEDVEPLWHALQESLPSEAAPAELGPLPGPAEIWQRRRRQYERWLQEPDAVLIIAERDGVPAGYAVAHWVQSFLWGERIAVIETLSTSPPMRARVAALIVDALRDYGRQVGARVWSASCLASNRDAARLFEFAGGKLTFLTYRGVL